jgi:predicted dehydrogenase
VTTDTIGIGIIGCGVIGRRHIANAVASPGVSTVAICDVSEAAVAAAAQEHDVQATYTNASDLLADDRVDGVVVALPAGVRHPVALSVLGAGKHLLTEKPAGLNAGQVRELIAARGDLIAGCCSSRQRFLPSAQAAAEFIASGELGDLRLIRGRGVRPAPAKPETLPPPWRLSYAMNGGGILANWGCYDLDFLLGLTGWSVRPQSVYAMAWPIADELSGWVVPDSDAEVHATALVRCADGVALTLERGEYLPVAVDGAWEFIGTRGSIRLSLVPVPGNEVHVERLDERGVTSSILWSGEIDGGVGHTGVLQDFVDAIREGRQPSTTLENALVIQEITDGVYTSARTGEAVPLSA